ncbi:DUF523 domain-containing protein [Azotosporobacter soli]|uniref:DUF523 domain-containing protein n=1 Tax=Azotosporobacter soli TaxID=3055040 RepID=UPI0031FE94D3
MMIVSACLAGVRCRYNGQAYPVPKVVELVESGQALPLCPEVLGGLPTPRACAEMLHGKVVTQDGTDVTSFYLAGAQTALEIATLVACKKAILKARSPSCGCDKIYDGSFAGRLVEGDGIFAARLKAQGIAVCTEEELV